MNTSEIFGTVWAILVVLVVGWEITGAIMGRTLSWEVWRYITGVWPDSPVPKGWKIFNRIFVAAFFLWLIVHFDFGWLSP